MPVTACSTLPPASTPARPQSALLELKQVAIQQLEFEDVWALFGEGKVSGQ